MTENKNMRIWQWAVLLLVLCNIGLIITMWLRPQHMPPHPGGPKDFVIQQLKFTDGQVKKYEALIEDHQQAMQHLREDGKELREALFANLKSENADNRLIDSLARILGDNQRQIELVTYRHFAQVRELCTDTQKKDFDNIIGDVLKRMGGGPGGGPHPPPGDRQGPPPPEGKGPPPGEGSGPPRDGPPPPHQAYPNFFEAD